MENPDQVLFAWFYHDFIMKKKSRVDEERSAQSAYNTAKNALLSDNFCNGVKNLVLSTKHDQLPETNDAKYF